MAYKRLFFFAFIFLLSINGALMGQEYLRPMQIAPALSGNFGEIRPNHFHTGLDYKTEGRIGVPVRAIADGYLSRVNISHIGYGKALYIDHPDGNTSVYGHLDRFAPRLDSAILASYYDEKSFWLNHYFLPSEVLVCKGEVIAYSGNTGSSGGPHLHFEVRTTDTERPINPQLLGFDLDDTMRPHLGGVLISAINNAGVVGSGGHDKWFSTVFYDEKYHLKGGGSLTAWGDIGIGFLGFDYISGDWSKCGILKAQLWVDESLVYEHCLDTLDFSTLRYTNAFVDYSYKYFKGRTIQKCYSDKPNNGLSIYKTLKNRGVITIKENRKYQITLKLFDIKDNCAELNFSISGVEQPLTTPLVDSSAIYYKWDVANEYRDSGIVFSIPDSALYDNTYFDIERQASDSYLSDVFDVHTPSDALNKYCLLKIKPKKSNTPLSKMCIVRLNSKNRIVGFETSVLSDDGFISSEVRLFGRYAIAADTVPPFLSSVDLNRKTKISAYKNIQFKCSDRSGLTRIDGYIDDKWVLFDYNPKKNLLTHTFDERRIKKGSEHRLLLEVEDGAGNIASYSKVFIW